jgi:hypothetical protein
MLVPVGLRIAWTQRDWQALLALLFRKWFVPREVYVNTVGAYDEVAGVLGAVFEEDLLLCILLPDISHCSRFKGH